MKLWLQRNTANTTCYEKYFNSWSGELSMPNIGACGELLCIISSPIIILKLQLVCIVGSINEVTGLHVGAESFFSWAIFEVALVVVLSINI